MDCMKILSDEGMDFRMVFVGNGPEFEELQGMARDMGLEGKGIFTGAIYECKAVILCTGTYLRARCLCGEAITYTGPHGLQAATHLTDSLKEMGIEYESPNHS